MSVSVTHRGEEWQDPSLIISFKDPLGRLRDENLDRSVAGTNEKALTPTDNLEDTPGLSASVGGSPASVPAALEIVAPPTSGTGQVTFNICFAIARANL